MSALGGEKIKHRRVGEKNYEGGAKSGAQAILLVIVLAIIISLAGIFFGNVNASALIIISRDEKNEFQRDLFTLNLQLK